ncbi:11691_t:CDS:2, partial [Scutellospora calospora]
YESFQMVIYDCELSYLVYSLGGIVSPSNPLYKEGELTFQFVDSGASIIFAHPNYLDVVVEAAENAKIPKSKIFLFGEKEVDGFQPYCSLIGDHEIEPVSYTSEEARTTIAFLCYSSGTTGKPKGVETTHTNIVANVAQITAVDNSRMDDIFMGVLNPIAKNYDISSLRMLISSAAPLSKSMGEKFYNILKIPIKQGYGLTEMSPATHVCKSDNIVAGSVGGLLPNIEAKIISEEGRELGCNESGELCVRGPNVMKGYLNNEEATKASIDEDGFLHTGDIAYVDDNRLPSGTIRLEEILLTHPAVADSAVVGYYSTSDLTEFPTAYVVTQPGYEQTPDLSKNIQQYISDRVAPQKKLRGGVVFIDQIPKSSAGKILRKILRDRLKTEFVYPVDDKL